MKMQLDENDRNDISERIVTPLGGYITAKAFAHPVLGWPEVH